MINFHEELATIMINFHEELATILIFTYKI